MFAAVGLQCWPCRPGRSSYQHDCSRLICMSGCSQEQQAAARSAEKERAQAAPAAASVAEDVPPGTTRDAAAEASASGRAPPPPSPEGNGRQGPAPGLDYGRGRGGRRGVCPSLHNRNTSVGTSRIIAMADDVRLAQGRRGGGRGRFAEEGRGRGGARGEGAVSYAARAAPPPAPGKSPAGGGAEPGFQDAAGPRNRGRTRGWETHTPAQSSKPAEPAQVCVTTMFISLDD